MTLLHSIFSIHLADGNSVAQQDFVSTLHIGDEIDRNIPKSAGNSHSGDLHVVLIQKIYNFAINQLHFSLRALIRFARHRQR